MALGNSCFGSLEYPRELPARVHMVSKVVESRGPFGMHYVRCVFASVVSRLVLGFLDRTSLSF